MFINVSQEYGDDEEDIECNDKNTDDVDDNEIDDDNDDCNDCYDNDVDDDDDYDDSDDKLYRRSTVAYEVAVCFRQHQLSFMRILLINFIGDATK